MKPIFVTVFFIGLLGCKQSSADTPSLPLDENTDLYDKNDDAVWSETENYQAALDFINGYVENIETMEILEYVNQSTLASANLKAALEMIVIEAWETNPKIGLDFDPLFDAQDFPSEGMELHEFNSETGHVLMKGIGWDEFIVAARIIKQNDYILVDGCGVVNMSEQEMASR